jgi:type IV secretory pathway VirB10-like protein
VELSSIGALSLSRTLEVHYNLQSVMDSIATTGSAKYHSKTKWWVVLLILLVVLVLLFCGAIFGLRFFNKRKSAAYKKRQRFKNRFKAQAEANLNELAERLPDEEEFPDEPRTEAEAVAAEAARKEQESLSRKLNLKMQAGKAVFDQKTSARKKESAEKKEERAVKKAERQAAKEAAKAEKAAKAAERAALDAENAAETFGTDTLPGHDAGTPDHTAPISFVSLDVPDPTTPAEPSEEVLPTAPVSEEEQSVIH